MTVINAHNKLEVLTYLQKIINDLKSWRMQEEQMTTIFNIVLKLEAIRNEIRKV